MEGKHKFLQTLVLDVYQELGDQLAVKEVNHSDTARSQSQVEKPFNFHILPFHLSPAAGHYCL